MISDRFRSKGYVPPEDDLTYAQLVGLGAAVRRARHAHGLSQWALETLADIDQTAISRLERGLAARFPAERLVRLRFVLGRELPLGYCPHDHECRWQPPEPIPGGTRRWPRRNPVAPSWDW
jgi:transcriptional regulator with XRE-family HTH domain